MENLELNNSFKNNIIEKKPLEDMSDVEFYAMCKEKYGHKEHEQLKPYKTITFKLGDKGFYSDDLNKIVLIDNHEPMEGVKVGIPYIVEILCDTKPEETRKGAIKVKVIKEANFEDVVNNKEANDFNKDGLVQIDFVRSTKNPDEVISRFNSRITFIDRGSPIKFSPKELGIGRIEERGNIYVFKPVMKAEMWQKVGLEAGYEGEPRISKESYNGIKKIRANIIFENDQSYNNSFEALSDEEKSIIKESIRRKQQELEVINENNNRLNAALEKAMNQAWEEYKSNKVRIERVHEQKYAYKVNIDDNWTEASENGNLEKEKWNTDGDWREFIANRAVEIINNDKIFFELLREKEEKDFDLNKIPNLIPENESLGTVSDSNEKIGQVINDFRQRGCETVNVDLPYIKGELVFDPVLLRYDDVNDGDYGSHKDDSSGNSNFQVIYKLHSEKIEFTDLVKSLPEHMSARVKGIIDSKINDLRQIKATYLQYEMANWLPDYKNKIDNLKKLTLEQRFLEGDVRDSNEKELLKEKMILTKNDFIQLQNDLPIEMYARPDGMGGFEYFGLSVERRQAVSIKHYSRTNMTTEIPIPGKYDYKFMNYGNEQLSFWLDSHKEYFEKMKISHVQNEVDGKLPKLEVSIEEETGRLCKEQGLKSAGHGTNEYYFEPMYGYVFNIYVKLSDDFSKLLVDVRNINSGFKSHIENVDEMYKIIMEKQWSVSEQVKRIFMNSGLSADKIENLKGWSKKIELSNKKELPFKGL